MAFSIDELPEWVEYGTLGVDLLFDAVTYKENGCRSTQRGKKRRHPG